MRISDWSSDVCSSDLRGVVDPKLPRAQHPRGTRAARGDGRGGGDADRAQSRPCRASAGDPRRSETGKRAHAAAGDRTSVGKGTSEQVRVDLGGGRTIKKKQREQLHARNI